MQFIPDTYAAAAAAVQASWLQPLKIGHACSYFAESSFVSGITVSSNNITAERGGIQIVRFSADPGHCAAADTAAAAGCLPWRHANVRLLLLLLLRCWITDSAG